MVLSTDDGVHVLDGACVWLVLGCSGFVMPAVSGGTRLARCAAARRAEGAPIALGRAFLLQPLAAALITTENNSAKFEVARGSPTSR